MQKLGRVGQYETALLLALGVNLTAYAQQQTQLMQILERGIKGVAGVYVFVIFL